MPTLASQSHSQDPSVKSDTPLDPSVCYATVLSRANSMERIDGRPYSPEDYSENGDLYKCIFAEKVSTPLFSTPLPLSPLPFQLPSSSSHQH